MIALKLKQQNFNNKRITYQSESRRIIIEKFQNYQDFINYLININGMNYEIILEVFKKYLTVKIKNI